MPKVIDESKIFNSALEIYISNGYEGATTHKIAEMAGVNEATLFRKYGSKAGLIERAITFKFSETPLNRLVFTGDLKADLLAIVNAYVKTYETHGNIISLLLIEMPRHPDLQGSFHTPWKNIQVMIEIIQKYQEQGQLINEAPIACLSALIGPIFISQMILRTNLNLPIPFTNQRAYVDAFLSGREM